MSIEKDRIYFGDTYIEKVFLGDQRIKYGTAKVGANPMNMRYIREYLAYSTMPNGVEDIVRTYIEVEAIDSNGINVARGKPVTAQPGYTIYGGTGNLNTLTDGNRSQYYSLQPQDKKLAWVQIDLGQVYGIEAINVWHYPDKRKFKAKVEVSEDGILWHTIYDSDVNGSYEETSAGKTHVLIDTHWQWPKNGFRYVRDYLKSNNSGAYTNEKHWLEMKVLDKNDFNIALDKPVTYTDGYSPSGGTGEPLVLTDGNTNILQNTDYVQLLPSDTNWVYMQVDLGKLYKPKNIKRWHYTKAGWKYKSKVMVSDDGVTWYRVFDTAFDGEYVDDDNGHTITTPYTDQSEIVFSGYRYIRDWIKNNSMDGYRNWNEIGAYTDDNKNVAYNKTVTVAPGYTITSGTLARIVDGRLNEWSDVGPMNGKWAWVQVDLGQVYPNITSLMIWHYYGDARKYNSRLEISQDGINWKPLYDYRMDGSYAETSNGKEYQLEPFKIKIPVVLWDNYTNYTNGEYDTFYTSAITEEMVIALDKKMSNHVTEMHKRITVTRDKVTGVDYIDNKYLIRVNGLAIHFAWLTFNRETKEDYFNNWFEMNIADR